MGTKFRFVALLVAAVVSAVSTVPFRVSELETTRARAASSCELTVGGGGAIGCTALAANVCPALPAARFSWSVSICSLVLLPMSPLSQHLGTLETESSIEVRL